MKTHYVYELYNLLGTIEYVGETTTPKHRFTQHKSSNQSSGNGKFYNRTDISMNIVKEFTNKKDAYSYQCQLQKEYGLITDSEINSKSKKGIINSKLKSTEIKLKISQTLKGRKHSEERKQKIREAAIRRWNTNKS